jgi:hypothetical protein
MVFVLGGLALVGLASVISPSKDAANAPHPLLGDVVIVAAQVVVSIQMVVEEKFIGKYNVPPLQVVGWEGFFGLTILSCLLIPFYYIPGDAAGGRLENAPDAFVQMGHSAILCIAIGGNILSIAFFNFFGISITKYASATTRMVLDSIRTVIIWAFSLIVGWQSFQYLQVIGFVLLLFGTIVYNEILKLNFGAFDRLLGYHKKREDQLEAEPLIPPHADQGTVQ